MARRKKEEMKTDSEIVNSEANEIIEDEEEIKEEVVEKKKKKKNKKEDDAQPELYKEGMTTTDKSAVFATILGLGREHKRLQLESKMIIPTGIKVLDAILGGGVAIGCLTMIVGHPGGGKSTLAAQIMGNAQKIDPEKNQFGYIYLDSENAVTKKRLRNLGVAAENVVLGGNVTLEKTFQVIHNLADAKEKYKLVDKPSVVIWDSIANTSTEKGKTITDPHKNIGLKPAIMASSLSPALDKCGIYNIALIAINQLRDVISMGGTPKARDLKYLEADKRIPGGQALIFNSFHILTLRIERKLDGGDKDKYKIPNSAIVKAVCIKNKLFPINIPVRLFMNFVTGFNDFYSSYIFLEEHKRINVGNFNCLINYPEFKYHVKDALKIYETNDKFREKFDELVAETIQIDIIDKYEKTDISNNEIDEVVEETPKLPENMDELLGLGGDINISENDKNEETEDAEEDEEDEDNDSDDEEEEE